MMFLGKPIEYWVELQAMVEAMAIPDTIENNIKLLRVARATEEFYVILERWSRAYPTDVFPEPPAGQHGKTVDACSASMGRHVTKKLLEDFGDVKEALKEVEHLFR